MARDISPRTAEIAAAAIFLCFIDLFLLRLMDFLPETPAGNYTYRAGSSD